MSGKLTDRLLALLKDAHVDKGESYLRITKFPNGRIEVWIIPGKGEDQVHNVYEQDQFKTGG